VSILSTSVSETANRYITIGSHTVSQNDILAALEAETGQKWQVSKKSSTEVHEKANEELANGNGLAVYDLVRVVTFGPGSPGDATKVKGGLWNARLRLPEEDLKESIRNILNG